MSEHKEPIPSMIYNAVVGGHVTTAQQILDENLNREQQDINAEVVALPYNPSLPNGMGKLVLKPTDDLKEIVEAQTDGNTIFVIKYDFEITEDVTIPQSCALDFEGGSIYGDAALTFANTAILGIPKILCDVAGSLTMADITWFGAVSGDDTIDSGAIINKIANVARQIIIPAGSFYIIDEMVVIPGGKIITWYGNIIYIGTATNVDVFTVKGTTSFNMYGDLNCASPSVYYTGEFGSNIKGLVFKNLVQRKAFVGQIYNFNVNMTVIGEGGGCTYNTFYIDTLTHGNIGILITQRDHNGSIGYANENTFIGGRIKQYGTWDYAHCEAHAVVVKKIYNDDSYDSCNSLYFLRICTEGPSNYIPYVFRNTQSIYVIAGRTEGVSNCATLSGSANLIHMDAIQGGTGYNFVDLLQSMNYELFGIGTFANYNLDIHNPLYGEISEGNYIAKNIWEFVDVYGSHSTGSLTYDSSKDIVSNIGFKVVFSVQKYNYLRLDISNDGATRRSYYINPIKKFNGTSIPANADRKNTVIRCVGLTFNGSYYYFTDGSDRSMVSILFASDVKEVMVSLTAVRAVNINMTEGYITTGY